MRSQRLSAEAIVKAETSRRSVEEATKALEDLKASAASERRELLKAVDDARREGEAKLLEYKDQQALNELKRKEEEGKAHLEAARKAQSDASDESDRHSRRLEEKLRAVSLEAKQLRARVLSATADQTAALRRLRLAYSTRVGVRPMRINDREHAMEIAASAVPPEAAAVNEDELTPTAMVGVVCGFNVSPAQALTMGFGADGADVEPLHVQLQAAPVGGAAKGGGGGGGAAATDGKRPLVATAVAVLLGGTRWAVRYVFDEPLWSDSGAAPLWGSELIDPASLGPTGVVLANKEGLIVSRGTVSVQMRPSDLERSARFDYRKAKRAATRLQAIYRGKHLRGKKAKKAKAGGSSALPGLGPALGGIAGAVKSTVKGGGAGAGAGSGGGGGGAGSASPSAREAKFSTKGRTVSSAPQGKAGGEISPSREGAPAPIKKGSGSSAQGVTTAPRR